MSQMRYEVEKCEAQGQHAGAWIVRWTDHTRRLMGSDEICLHFRLRREAVEAMKEILNCGGVREDVY